MIEKIKVEFTCDEPRSNCKDIDMRTVMPLLKLFCNNEKSYVITVPDLSDDELTFFKDYFGIDVFYKGIRINDPKFHTNYQYIDWDSEWFPHNLRWLCEHKISLDHVYLCTKEGIPNRKITQEEVNNAYAL